MSKESSPFALFVTALEQLCRDHGVTLSTSGYDGLQVWDANEKLGSICCADIENRMKQTQPGSNPPPPPDKPAPPPNPPRVA